MIRTPVTRLYRMRAADNFGWARIWITDDGWISIISDYGNYGHIFDAPGCEFRAFLASAYPGYITDKLAYGSPEVIVADESERRIRRRICELRREKRLTREAARDEWDLISECSYLDDVQNQVRWYEHTHLQDAHDLFRSERRALPQIREFMKQCWPIFVAQLNADRGQDRFELVSALTAAGLPGELFSDPEVQAFIAW